jgi:hypothetical protein
VRSFVIGLSIAIILGLGGFIGIMVYKRQTTGDWKIPTRGDLVRIKDKLVRRSDAGPSRIIYLHRAPIELTGGPDDASRNISSVLAASGVTAAKMPGYTGSAKDWSWIVTCVGKKFEAFDVAVTDQRPQSDDYIMVVVGGEGHDIGGTKSHRHAGGLAPFNGKVIPKAVVFAFSKALRNHKRNICEVIGMEVGHAYGLDHGYHCRDLMTYLDYCGYKRFQDLDIPCGESKKRPCASGRPTQNSYRHLMELLGPGAQPSAAPNPG